MSPYNTNRTANQSEQPVRAQSSAVAAVPAYRVGVVETTVAPRVANEASVSLTFSGLASFMFTEYFKGILFVALSTVFIFALPAYLSRPAKAKAMLGRAFKRLIDIVGSIAGLILTAPVWLILPIVIELDSSGPVFYSQLRVGINRRKKNRRFHQKSDVIDKRDRDRRRDDCFGRPFMVYKFRTMVANAEKSTGPVWAAKNDCRVTRIGAFLRKSRLDEIPQFINVLKGDMSLVGPRPERPTFVSELSGKIDGYTDRLQVKPGLTGLAQVEGGYDTSVASVAEKVRYDLEYINNWSVWTDIKIMLKTVIVVFTGRGAQ